MVGILNSETCLSQAWGNVNGTLTDTEIASKVCPPAWDGLTCWPPTLAGDIAFATCPAFKGSDITKSSFRVCSSSGEWLDRNGLPSSMGWTNYTLCLTPEIREIMKKLGTNDEAQRKIDIAANTRVLEFVGLSLSLAALLLSLLIFYYFRTLRNSRTTKHRHLFIAMAIQVAIRLIVYTDQAITRSFEPSSSSLNTNTSTHTGNSTTTTHVANQGATKPPHWQGIDNTPVLCEASYICLEYARTAMFMWMFVEGLFLHNMITVTVFEEKISPLVYPILGWVVPIPLTFAWAFVTHLHYGSATCWWGYNFTLYFWILEGPRLAVLVVNFVFLLNILRVLVTKLKQSSSTELQQAMKAVKAALVLLPLLGLTNLLSMLDAPLDKSPLQFAFWSYSTHLLTSTQGFVVAFLYCFKNGEVRNVVRKFLRVRCIGRTKQIILTKAPIPLAAMQSNSFLHNSSNPSDDPSYSQTVNMVNTEVCPVVVFARNKNTHATWEAANNKSNKNNSENLYQDLPLISLNVSSTPKCNSYSSLEPLQQDDQLLTTAYKGKQISAISNCVVSCDSSPGSGNPGALQQQQNHSSVTNTHKQRLFATQRQKSISLDLVSESQVTDTSIVEYSLQKISTPANNVGMTYSSSWSFSGKTSSSTSSSKYVSYLNIEQPTHHKSAALSYANFQTQSTCQNNNLTRSKINNIGRRIVNSWSMQFIPEALLKRLRGCQQQTDNGLDCSRSNNPSQTFNKTQISNNKYRSKVRSWSDDYYDEEVRELKTSDVNVSINTTEPEREFEENVDFYVGDEVTLDFVQADTAGSGNGGKRKLWEERGENADEYRDYVTGRQEKA